MVVQGSEASSWLVAVGPEGARLTAAGWWCVLVSNPLFLFLLLRWLWRHAVWGLLLRDLARLELRLVATHPDGAGGLAFIGQYPNAFAAFVFALSCVLGAAIAHTLLRGGLTATAYGQLMGAWLVVVIILFGAPLLAFSGPLQRLKGATLLTANSVATRHERAVERELLGRNMAAASDAEATASADIPDPSKLHATASKLSTFLISRSAIVPVAAAALLPLVAAGATQLPFRELLKIARGSAAAMTAGFDVAAVRSAMAVVHSRLRTVEGKVQNERAGGMCPLARGGSGLCHSRHRVLDRARSKPRRSRRPKRRPRRRLSLPPHRRSSRRTMRPRSRERSRTRSCRPWSRRSRSIPTWSWC